MDAAGGMGGPKTIHYKAPKNNERVGQPGILDVLGTGAQCVAPPSLHGSGEVREWENGIMGDPAIVDCSKLYAAAEKLAVECGWKPKTKPTTATGHGHSPDVVNRALIYLSRIPGAVSGAGGHDQTLAAARAIVYGFDLGPSVGFDLLWNHYNDRCQPPWTEAELRHKCQDADTVPFDKPRGFLRDGDHRTSTNAAATSATETHCHVEPPPQDHSTEDQSQDSEEPEDQLHDHDEQENPGPSPTEHNGFRNFFEQVCGGEGNEDEGEKVIKVGFPVTILHNALQKFTGGWPKTANGLLFTTRDDYEPLWFKNQADLFAWIGGKLPGRQNGLIWMQGPDKVSQQQFHAFTVQNAERFDAVEQFPHYPPMPKHHYMHPPLQGGDGRAFSELVRRFSPSTAVDHDLIVSAWLTPFAGIEAGQRPAILIQAEDEDKHGGRGAGKTTFAELVGRLCGGHVEIRATDDWDRLVTRLLSPNALTKRIALLDNVKTLRFSWAELEAGITAAVISGRQLYVGEGRRPNTLTYFITLNGANLSKDMSQRSVPIVLKRPKYDAAWEEKTIALIENRRWEIIGDIIAILKGPAPKLLRYSRWSTWEQAVLSRVGDPSECQRVIEERQAAIDDDQTTTDLVREGIREILTQRGHDPEKDVIWIPSAVAAPIINAIENELHRPFPRTMVHLYTLQIPEIHKSNRGTQKGCVWAGGKAEPGTAAVRIFGGP